MIPLSRFRCVFRVQSLLTVFVSLLQQAELISPGHNLRVRAVEDAMQAQYQEDPREDKYDNLLACRLVVMTPTRDTHSLLPILLLFVPG